MKYQIIIVVIIITLVLLPACRSSPTTTSISTSIASSSTLTTSTSSPYAPGEAIEYEGLPLTPISEQGNNALAGTQHIDRNTYRLRVDGLVDNPLSLSYDDLQKYPQISKAVVLYCVEGWYFNAKWTGPSLESIFSDAGVKPEAQIAIFYTMDVPEGYTSLDLVFIHDNNIILGMKLNDLIVPEERGFPFKVVAEHKSGYKWAKWVTRIELSDNTAFRGYWESAGYPN